MTMSRKDEAERRTQELRNLDMSSRESWWYQGEHVWHVHDKALWKDLDLPSFKAWLEATIPISRQTAHEAMRCWFELRGLDGFKEIPKENAKILYKQVPQSRRKRYLKAAKTMPTRKFRALVEEGKVGAAKAENTVVKHWVFTEEAWEHVNRALTYLLATEQISDPAIGVEMMAVEFMQDPNRGDWEEPDADTAAESAE